MESVHFPDLFVKVSGLVGFWILRIPVGLKYSSNIVGIIHLQSFIRGGAMAIAGAGFGLGVGEGGCGMSPKLIVLGVKRRRYWFELRDRMMKYRKGKMKKLDQARTPGLDPVPSLEALEMTVDSSGTPSMLPVPSFEPPVPGYLLLIFLLSLRAFILSASLLLAGVRV
ncbi:hypothetical protein Tco_0489475 [Tanacetum coccineum]